MTLPGIGASRPPRPPRRARRRRCRAGRRGRARGDAAGDEDMALVAARDDRGAMPTRRRATPSSVAVARQRPRRQTLAAVERHLPAPPAQRADVDLAHRSRRVRKPSRRTRAGRSGASRRARATAMRVDGALGSRSAPAPLALELGERGEQPGVVGRLRRRPETARACSRSISAGVEVGAARTTALATRRPQEVDVVGDADDAVLRQRRVASAPAPAARSAPCTISLAIIGS